MELRRANGWGGAGDAYGYRTRHTSHAHAIQEPMARTTDNHACYVSHILTEAMLRFKNAKSGQTLPASCV